jgi:hypothetical protein
MTEYQNFADQPQPQLLPIADRARAVNVVFLGWIAMVVLVGLFELAVIIPGFSELAGQGSTDASNQRLLELANQSLAVGGIGVLVNLAAGITYLVWLYRARDNAERISTWQHRRSRAWLFWGWIVPVVNFWFPYQIVSDIRSASLGPAGGDNEAKPSVNLLNWWWGLYVLQTFGSVLILYMTNSSPLASVAEVAASSRDSLMIGLLQIPLGIAAAVLAIRVVQGITDLQARRS